MMQVNKCCLIKTADKNCSDTFHNSFIIRL